VNLAEEAGLKLKRQADGSIQFSVGGFEIASVRINKRSDF
jgi:hypothetical protein